MCPEHHCPNRGTSDRRCPCKWILFPRCWFLWLIKHRTPSRCALSNLTPFRLILHYFCNIVALLSPHLIFILMSMRRIFYHSLYCHFIVTSFSCLCVVYFIILFPFIIISLSCHNPLIIFSLHFHHCFIFISISFSLSFHFLIFVLILSTFSISSLLEPYSTASSDCDYWGNGK